MGTGNDLAREFGWGGSFDPNEDEFEDIFDRFEKAEPSPLDMYVKHRWSASLHAFAKRFVPFSSWRVDIRPQKEIAGDYRQSDTTTQYMFNYFNMGMDRSEEHLCLLFYIDQSHIRI